MKYYQKNNCEIFFVLGINRCYDYSNSILILSFLEIKRCILSEYIESYIGVYKNAGIDKKNYIQKDVKIIRKSLAWMGLIIHGSFHGNIFKNNFSFICFETSKLTV